MHITKALHEPQTCGPQPVGENDRRQYEWENTDQEDLPESELLRHAYQCAKGSAAESKRDQQCAASKRSEPK